MEKYESQKNRIREKVTAYAAANVMDFRQAWKIVYTELTERTGINPWKGRGNGIDNVEWQGGLDDLEIIVDELTGRIE